MVRSQGAISSEILRQIPSKNFVGSDVLSFPTTCWSCFKIFQKSMFTNYRFCCNQMCCFLCKACKERRGESKHRWGKSGKMWETMTAEWLGEWIILPCTPWHTWRNVLQTFTNPSHPISRLVFCGTVLSTFCHDLMQNVACCDEIFAIGAGCDSMLVKFVEMDKVTHVCPSRSKAHYLQKAFRGRWDISKSLQLCHFVEAQEICAPMKSDDSCFESGRPRAPHICVFGGRCKRRSSKVWRRGAGQWWPVVFYIQITSNPFVFLVCFPRFSKCIGLTSWVWAWLLVDLLEQ